MPKNKKKRPEQEHPPLVPLRYAPVGRDVYCELCGNVIKVGEPVAWWKLLRHGAGGRAMRPTAYCQTCHSTCVRQGEPSRARARGLPPKSRRARAISRRTS